MSGDSEEKKPLWKAKALFELNPIKISMNYYIIGQESPVHTNIIQEQRRQKDKEVTSENMWKLRYVSPYRSCFINPLIKSMEENTPTSMEEKYFSPMEKNWYGPEWDGPKWDAENNTLTFKSDYDLKCMRFTLCPASRKQFIEELKKIKDLEYASVRKGMICNYIRNLKDKSDIDSSSLKMSLYRLRTKKYKELKHKIYKESIIDYGKPI